MRRVLGLATAMVISFTCTLCAQVEKSIRQEEVARIIKKLSSDEMQGRATFTPGIDKAATYIASEFKRIGLEPIVASDYKQNFQVYLLRPENKSLKLNNKAIAPESFFIRTSRMKIDWNAKSHKLNVVKIGPKDDARQELDTLFQPEGKDVIVLVDTAHRELFDRYKDYFDAESQHMELDKGKTIVVVLGESKVPASYEIKLNNKVETLSMANVAGKIIGKRKDEYVLFSAHYDHLGIVNPLEGDSIANGADDDASGVTAVIALAEYYKKKGQPERTLLFVAFTAEEIGGHGSKYFSEKLNPDQIVAMTNIEMIGKPSRFGPNTAYLTGFDKSDLGKLMQKSLQGSAYAIHPDPYPEQNLFYRSDNATLARLGVPAHTISSSQMDKDTLYHTVNDEFESLDVEHLTNMIRAIAKSMEGIVSGASTPDRVDKSQVK